MATQDDQGGDQAANDFRFKRIERKLAGVQRQVTVLRAIIEKQDEVMDRRVLTLEIKEARAKKVKLRTIGAAVKLSTSSVSRIARSDTFH